MFLDEHLTYYIGLGITIRISRLSLRLLKCYTYRLYSNNVKIQL